jgi:hypothetical protein
MSSVTKDLPSQIRLAYILNFSKLAFDPQAAGGNQTSSGSVSQFLYYALVLLV